MTRTANDDSWRRLSLADLFVIVFCCAIGAAAARALPHESATWPLLSRSATWQIMIVGLVIGSELSGAVVLAKHFWLKGRKPGITVGEFLWIAPSVAACLASLFMSSMFPNLFWLAWLLFFQIVLAIYAAIVAMLRWNQPVPCTWTYRAGLVVTMLAGPLLVIALW